MYESNGRRRLLRQIQRRNVWRERARVVRMTLLLLPPPVRMACVLMLLALVMLLVGCATQSPPDNWPRNPPPPQLSEPLPQNSYSSKAQLLIESWLKRLTGT